MKNISLIAFITLITTSINAQDFSEKALLHTNIKQEPMVEIASFNNSTVLVENVIWHEDFANGLIGSNDTDSSWTITGPDGAIWEYDTDGSNGQYSSENLMESPSAANGWMIFDADGSNTPGTPNTFENREGQLVSPTFDLSAYPNVSLSFEQYFRWCCYANHEILVELSNDGGITWPTSYPVKGAFVTNEDSGTHTFVLNITPAAGGQENVKFRFNWAGAETASHYFWMIDDVKLIASPEHSLQVYEENFGGWFTTPISEGYALDYTFIPLSQAANNPYKFEAIISNEGSATQENIVLNATVLASGGGVLSTETSDPITIYPLQFGDDPLIARDTFVTTNYTATETGELTFEYYASSDDTISNTKSIWSFVTENEFGRDKNTSSNSRNYITNDGGGLELGNLFDIYTSENLYGVRAYIHPDYSQPGTKAYGILYEYGEQFIYLMKTQDKNINADDLGWKDFIFDTPIPLTAGTQYFIGVGGVSNFQDTIAIGNSGTSQAQTSYLHDVDGTTNNFTPATWYYTLSTPMVRALMGENPSASIAQKELINTFQISPNPSKGMININSNNTITKIIIKDALGKSIYENENENTNIDLSHLIPGAYFISCSQENGDVITKKLIIQ